MPAVVRELNKDALHRAAAGAGAEAAQLLAMRGCKVNDYDGFGGLLRERAVKRRVGLYLP